MSASLAVQKLVAASLAAIPGITGVYDGPPADAAPPYLVIGSDVVTDWGTKTAAGHEHRLSIGVWDSGPGTVRAKALMGLVEAALLAMSGSSGGHSVASVRFMRSLALTDPGGWTQGIVDIRVRSISN